MSNKPKRTSRISRLPRKVVHLLAVAGVLALSLLAVPAWAQGGSGTTGSSSTSGTTAGSTGTMGATGNTLPPGMAKTDAAKIDRADSRLIEDLAENNRAEIAAGKLALEKSQNAEVKKFAQQMIDDHSKALTEIQSLAQTKGIKLPDGTGVVNKTRETALKALSGETFDKQYSKRAGIGDHEKTVKLLQKIQKDARDPELKAMAAKMLPGVQEHLQMAKAMSTAK